MLQGLHMIDHVARTRATRAARSRAWMGMVEIVFRLGTPLDFSVTVARDADGAMA